MSCLFLFTRDFRLVDNKTLDLVKTNKYTNIIPVFIFTPEQFSKDNEYRSDNSLQLMVDGLQNLDNTLNNTLNIYSGDTELIIKLILDSHPEIECLATNLDITPFGTERNEKLADIAQLYGKQFLSACDYNLLPLDDIMSGAGTYYKTFTHFKKKVIAKSNIVLESITDDLTNYFQYHSLAQEPSNPYSSNLTSMRAKITINRDNIFLPFTRNDFLSQHLSDKNLKKFQAYEKFRTYPQYNTTLFSAYMKYGLISCREIYSRIYNYYGDETELLKQLVWREYYYYLMYHLPVKNSIGGSNMQEKDYTWENNQDDINAWKLGMTGFPFIDACMRQMLKTGWMHNRSRLVSANALVYLFLIDWKIGEKYFATKLADYDISQNNGNWQWCGGVGVDRKPYLRMYNPYSLIEKYDPDCVYVKKWIPELSHLTKDQLLKYDKYISDKNTDINGYPLPIVDYKEARTRAKGFFK